MKMHEHELKIDEEIVKDLINNQYPSLANLSIKAVASSGTDNALFRLGNDYIVRLPRIEWTAGSVDKNIAKEYEWIPKIAKFLQIPISVPIFKGHADASYPWSWTISKWNEGVNPNFEEKQSWLAISRPL